MIQNAFEHQNKLILLKGDCGVGKTYLIQQAFASCSKKSKLIVYDTADFSSEKFLGNLYSKKLDGSKVVIVLSHLEAFRTPAIHFIAEWTKSRTNFTRSVDFIFKSHASVIIETDISYNTHINKLSILRSETMVLLQPSSSQLLSKLQQTFPDGTIDLVSKCSNYYDIDILINDLQHDAHFKPTKPTQIVAPIKICKNPQLQLHYQKQALRNINIEKESIYETKSNPKDKHLFKANLFECIDYIRNQSRQARGFNSFRCLDYDIDDIASKYHALLPAVYGLQSQNNDLKDISDSMNTFCDTDLYHFPYELKEAFYQVAINQSPVYEQKGQYQKFASTGNENLKAFQWGNFHKEKLDFLYNIRIAIDCFGVDKLSFLETLWMMYDSKNLLEWEVFPKGFLDWNEDHRKAHNELAIQYTRFSGKKEEIKKRKYNREEAAAKRQLLGC